MVLLPVRHQFLQHNQKLSLKLEIPRFWLTEVRDFCLVTKLETANENVWAAPQ